MSAMELRHLRYFLVVGEVLNFTKAAARLRVAQHAAFEASWCFQMLTSMRTTAQRDRSLSAKWAPNRISPQSNVRQETFTPRCGANQESDDSTRWNGYALYGWAPLGFTPWL